MTNQPSVDRARLAIVAVCLAVLATFGWSTPVRAHTDFEGSVPADGATVDGPISTVTVEFTNPAVESGDGFELLEPDGTIRTPDSVDPTDGTSFLVMFDPPLEAGTYGFRWDVQAGDAHPIQGSFRFTVEGPAATTLPDTSVPQVAAPATPPSTTVPVDHSTMSMHEFLDHDAPEPFLGRAARMLSMTATIFAGGVIAALTLVVRGRRTEIERLLGWVRLAGVGLITGGLTALAALDEIQPSSLSDIATSKPGAAALLTIAGGLFVGIGFGPAAGNVVAPARSLSAAVATDPGTGLRRHADAPAAPDPEAVQLRWTPDPSSALGLAGIAMALAAYWFDGHTVSRGPWILHAAVNLVHVAGASVWVGGVFTMTLVAWMRRRRRADTGLAAMVVRFSTIATATLGALGAAGVVMAWLVLESPGDLFATDWGRLLVIKVGAVLVAAGTGGYNHVVLRPALEARPADPDVAAHLRRSLAIESGAMLVVIAITAVLVASST